MAPEARSILLVDDEEANRLLISRRLQHDGHQVVTAENGRKAIERLRERHFDLVLLDMNMPEMDGLATLQAVKADDALRGIPVLMLTAASDRASVVRCIGLGAVDYLVKPVEPGELRRRVGRYLGGGAAEGGSVESTAAAEGAAGVDVVDWAELTDRFPDRQEFVAKLINTVLAGHGEAPARLRTLAAARDWEQLALLAHTLKGLGGNLKARRVHELGGQAETSARGGASEAVAQAEQLACAVEAMLAAMRSRLAAGEAK
jgi:CheY-like chemotaxis protein